MPVLEHDFSDPLPSNIVLGGDAVEEVGFVELSPTNVSSGWVDAILGSYFDLEVTATWGTSDGDGSSYDDPGQSFDISVAVTSQEDGYRIDRVLSVEWNHYYSDIRLRIDGVQVANVSQTISDTTGSTRIMHESGLRIRHDSSGNAQVVVRFDGNDVLTHDFDAMVFDGDRVRFGALSTQPDYARHGIYSFWIEYTTPPVDLYRDFSYARVIQTIGESDDTIFVDSVDRFPPNLILAKSRFLLTIESDLQSGDFEIVRLMEVDDGARTLRVQRGAEGTSAAAHQAYTVIKGAVTAQMLYRARSLFIFQEMPEVDYDIFVDGDTVWDRVNQIAYMLIDDEWISLTVNAQAAIESIQASIMNLAGSVSEHETTLYGSPTIQAALALLGGYLSEPDWRAPVLRDQSMALGRIADRLRRFEEWETETDDRLELLDLLADAHVYQQALPDAGVRISFAYHMYGSSTGTLRLQVTTDDGESWSTVWEEIGNQGNEWYEAELAMQDFGYLPGQDLRFRFVYFKHSSTDHHGDTCLDAIRIINGDVDDFAGFEEDLDGWIDGGGDLSWQRNSGNTGSTGTGPTMGAFEGTYYVYAEVSGVAINDTFILENPNTYSIIEGQSEEVVHAGLDSLTAAIALG